MKTNNNILIEIRNLINGMPNSHISYNVLLDGDNDICLDISGGGITTRNYLRGNLEDCRNEFNRLVKHSQNSTLYQ